MALWRDISVVFIIFETFILLLVPLGVLYFALRGMQWVRRKLAALLQSARQSVATVPGRAEQISRRISDPVVNTRRRLTKFQAATSALWPGGASIDPQYKENSREQ